MDLHNKHARIYLYHVVNGSGAMTAYLLFVDYIHVYMEEYIA